MPMPGASTISPPGTGVGAGIDLRPARAEDETFLRSLFLAEARDLFAPAGPSEPMLAVLLDHQYRAHTAGCARDYPDARHRLILVEGEPVGRITTASDPRAAGRTLRIVDIALAAAWRGRGVGTIVLTRIGREAADEGWTALSLTVAHGNPAAARLYLRLGFRAVGADAIGTSMERPLGDVDRGGA